MNDPLADLAIRSRPHHPVADVAAAIIERVLRAELPMGHRLPRPRVLAAQLTIAVAVIEDAYDDLIRLGILDDARRISAEAPQAAARWARAEVRAQLRTACRSAEALGLNQADVAQILADIQQTEVRDG